jgi:hypothetical protein
MIPGKWSVAISEDSHSRGIYNVFIYKGASCVCIGQATSRAGAWKEAHARMQSWVRARLGSYIRPGQAGHVCVGVCCQRRAIVLGWDGQLRAARASDHFVTNGED